MPSEIKKEIELRSRRSFSSPSNRKRMRRNCGLPANGIGASHYLLSRKPCSPPLLSKVEPRDVASRVDPKRNCTYRSRYIDGGKLTLAQQKTTNVAAAVSIDPYDVALRI